MEHSQIHRSALLLCRVDLVLQEVSCWVCRERAEELGEEAGYHLSKGAAVF
jgi:hypothetical protein